MRVLGLRTPGDVLSAARPVGDLADVAPAADEQRGVGVIEALLGAQVADGVGVGEQVLPDKRPGGAVVDGDAAALVKSRRDGQVAVRKDLRVVRRLEPVAVEAADLPDPGLRGDVDQSDLAGPEGGQDLVVRHPSNPERAGCPGRPSGGIVELPLEPALEVRDQQPVVAEVGDQQRWRRRGARRAPREARGRDCDQRDQDRDEPWSPGSRTRRTI